MRTALWGLVAVLMCAAPAAAEPIASRAGIAAARHWAQQRRGEVSFAVVTPGHRVRGLRRRRTFPSASVSKAMLLVATLRGARGRPLTRAERRRLAPMIERSSNRAGRVVFARLGGAAALLRVAEAARMRHFVPSPFPFEQGIAAGDQARFFLRIDRLVPRRHRAYAEHLLSHVVARQRWGIPAVADRRGLTTYLKGGWRPGIVHQVALLRAPDGRRIALAVLTANRPSKHYGERTVAGIARRLLG